MADPPSTALLWALMLLVTALPTSQVIASYTSAYMAAPREITAFIDAVDFSIEENESYDRDVSSVPRLEDKVRLGRLLREIQKGSDDLRENLNRLMISQGGTSLQTSTRILWAAHRKELGERVRRLDLLRMRFLVVYMGIVATTERESHNEKATPTDAEKMVLHRDAPRPGFLRSLSRHKPPTRRLTTQAIGHSEKTEPPHRIGWMGVVAELQRSPLMHKRRASVESSMTVQSPLLSSPPLLSPPLSPLSSPSPSPIGKTASMAMRSLPLSPSSLGPSLMGRTMSMREAPEGLQQRT